MTQIEKIKSEIERRINAYQKNFDKADNKIARLSTDGRIASLKSLLTFINSLQAEPVSEDLEKELNNQMDSIYPLPEEDDFDDPCYSESNAIRSQRIGFKKGFKIGANWQKEQMIAKAIDGEVGYWNIRGLFVNMEMPNELEEGDKVKLVIVKEG